MQIFSFIERSMDLFHLLELHFTEPGCGEIEYVRPHGALERVGVYIASSGISAIRMLPTISNNDRAVIAVETIEEWSHEKLHQPVDQLKFNIPNDGNCSKTVPDWMGTWLIKNNDDGSATYTTSPNMLNYCSSCLVRQECPIGNPLLRAKMPAIIPLE